MCEGSHSPLLEVLMCKARSFLDRVIVQDVQIIHGESVRRSYISGSQSPWGVSESSEEHFRHTDSQLPPWKFSQNEA